MTDEELAQKAAADTAARLAALEAENKELIASRDKAKQKAREAEEAKLAENAEFKTLAERRQAELDALAKEKAELSDKMEGYRKRDEAKLAKLMESVPDDKKALIKESWSLEDRIELAESFAAMKATPAPGTRLPGDNTDTSLQQKYDDAVKAGDITASISLKRQMYEQRK